MKHQFKYSPNCRHDEERSNLSPDFIEVNLFFKLNFLIVLFFFISSFNYAQTINNDSCTFFNNKPIYPYYVFNGLSNGKDFYTQKNEFKKAITEQTQFNGIITIYFFINDNGEPNFYTTQLCDLNYKAIKITNETEPLCVQILQAVKNTAPWKPMRDENNETVNCRKFYSFKFNNGQLIEILPK